MKRCLLLTLVLIICAAPLFMGCTSRVSSGDMKKAYGLLNTNPDSAVHLLAPIDRNRLNLSDKAYCSLLYTMALDKSGPDVDNDSLIRTAYNYYKDRPSDSLFAQCMFYMGKYYYSADSVKLSVELFEKAQNAASIRGDLYTTYLALNRLSIALQVSNPQRALSASKQAYALFCQFDSTNLYNRVFLLMGIGNSYDSCGYPDSTLYYMRKALQLAYQSQNKELIGESCHSMSFAFRKAGQLDSALHYSHKAFQMVEQKSSYLYMQLSQCYFDVDSLAQSDSLARKALELTAIPRTKYAVYRRLLDIQLKKDGNRQAQQYADSALSALSSMYYHVQNENTLYQDDNLQLTEEKAATEKHFNYYLYISICILVVLLSVAISLYMVYESNKKMSQKQIEFEKERSKLVREKQQIKIENREKQIKLLKNYILLKAKELSAMKEHKRFSEMSDSDWADIENYVNGMYSDFATKFREAYPDLNEENIRFCLLIKIGMTNTELQEFYSRGMQAIKQRLLNLKPKLGIANMNISAREFLMEKFNESGQ